MFTEAYETFEAHREEWLAEHWGEYVVIAAHHVLGFFPSLDLAYDAGRRHYGPEVFFLVLRVVDYDQLAAVY
jgi:hypothetical protein